MRVQAVHLQRLRHAESVEHAANALDAKAPEGTFAELVDQLLESAQLVCSSRVDLHLATFPARPDVRCHPEQVRRLGLRPIAECTSEVEQV